MGRKPSIDESTGHRLLAAYQRLGSKAAAAAEVGVSESAARRYFAATPQAAAPMVTAQRTVLETAGASLFDTRQALAENYQRLLTLVAHLEAGIVERRTASTGTTYETDVSPAILLAALKEVREHVQSGIKLYHLLLDVDEVRTFQQAVLEAIGETDEPTRQRIITKLQERRAVGLTP